MEALFTSLNQHISSLINIYIIKNVNTGDRMLDSTIQGIVTLVSASLIALIVGIYKSGAIYTYIIILLSYCKLSSFSSIKCDPLNFKPSSAPGKGANKNTFMYSLYLIKEYRGLFWIWFYKYHSHKKYILESQSAPLRVPIDNITTDCYDKIITNINDFEFMNNYDPSRDSLNKSNLVDSVKESNLPIWYDYDVFEWVYVQLKNGPGGGVCLSLVSDSSIAIKNCFNSMKQYTNYNNYIENNQNSEKLKIYKMNSSQGIGTNGYINTKKTFDNLKFENKENILNILQKFKDDKLYPTHLSLDNKLGIILHGTPGTGKTGFISCLANFLHRHVIIVDMNTIKTRNALDSLFRYGEDNKYMYVFEEIDSMKCVLRRDGAEYTTHDKDENNTKDNSYLMMLMATKDKSEDIVNMHNETQNKLNDTLTLGYLLQTLDGMQSADGRVIVATTNYPERIDSALLRPGRFGLSIHLKNCNKQILTEIIGMIYQTTITLDDVKDIPDYKWSPVQVMQQGIMEPDYTSLIQKLIHRNPVEFN